MQILIISDDHDLINSTICPEDMNDCSIKVYNNSGDPLDIVSTVCVSNPSVLVVDDDFLKPETGHILTSIKKIITNLAVVFI
ncbi:MAG: hypothetical protein P8X42_15970, partial [Calditrichaceae bacterium]